MARIPRDVVLNSILQLYEAPSYLEVGVNKGITFDAIKAAKKVAVDPRFMFTDPPPAPEGCDRRYHEVTSDAYFGGIATQADSFDVIYLDGLHTFEQTLRDLINAIEFLKPNGVIVIDDVLPSSYLASLPNISDVRATKALVKSDNGDWMGDVYKLVFFIESFFQHYSFATIADNHGQLVMWRQPRAKVQPRPIDFFLKLQFMHCATERTTFRLMPFNEILSAVKEHVFQQAESQS